MTDSFIQVAADSSGKKVDNELVIIAGTTVYRQRVELKEPGWDVVYQRWSSAGVPELHTRDLREFLDGRFLIDRQTSRLF